MSTTTIRLFQKRRLLALAASLVICAAVGDSAEGNWVVGSFNQSRGGFDSLDDPGQADQKALILFLHPEVTFSSTSTLTSAYLSTVNTMVIGDGFDVSHTITALSAAEQSALFQFVSNGGNLAVFTENSNYDLANGAASRASLLSPFGLATTGWIVNDTASIVASPTHPIALGPGGPLTQFDLHNTGWLTSMGPYAHTIAIETATGMPVMAAIERARSLRPADAQCFLPTPACSTTALSTVLSWPPTWSATWCPSPALPHKPPWHSSASRRSWASIAAKPGECHGTRKSAGSQIARCAFLRGDGARLRFACQSRASE